MTDGDAAVGAAWMSAVAAGAVDLATCADVFAAVKRRFEPRPAPVQNAHRHGARWARDKAGFGWVTPHVLRKSVATAMALTDLRLRLTSPGTAVTERHYVRKTHEVHDARSALATSGRNGP